MRIEFTKMHGTMNDFIVFQDLEDNIELSEAAITRLCDRRSGIGGDGIIAVRSSSEADFFMDYRNSDGSIAEMCGNGIRCTAKYCFDTGLTFKETVTIQTRAGVKEIGLTIDSGVVKSARVDMGPPIFEAAGIPVLAGGSHEPILDLRVESNGRTFKAAVLSMGNPHCVIFLDEDVKGLPSIFGPEIEISPQFPAKTNVEFIKVIDRSRLDMRVWERGSGETFACGTGACAAGVAALLRGFVTNPITVELAGGDLIVEWNGVGSSVFMTGPAESVFTGSITI
jgi:diaminopimelate epimerase